MNVQDSDADVQPSPVIGYTAHDDVEGIIFGCVSPFLSISSSCYCLEVEDVF